MTTNELIAKVEELNKLKNFIKEVQLEADALENEIKKEMEAQQTEEMMVGHYIVRYTTVISDRFDTGSFKRVQPELYSKFIKQSVSRRFSIK